MYKILVFLLLVSFSLVACLKGPENMGYIQFKTSDTTNFKYKGNEVLNFQMASDTTKSIKFTFSKPLIQRLVLYPDGDRTVYYDADDLTIIASSVKVSDEVGTTDIKISIEADTKSKTMNLNISWIEPSIASAERGFSYFSHKLPLVETDALFKKQDTIAHKLVYNVYKMKCDYIYGKEKNQYPEYVYYSPTQGIVGFKFRKSPEAWVLQSIK